jgi:hypothetical protein
MQAKPEKRKEGTCHRSIKTLKPQYLTTALSQSQTFQCIIGIIVVMVTWYIIFRLKQFALGVSKQDKHHHHHHHTRQY